MKRFLLIIAHVSHCDMGNHHGQGCKPSLIQGFTHSLPILPILLYSFQLTLYIYIDRLVWRIRRVMHAREL